jgi:phosphoribosylanthranilate isomerase
MGETGQNRRTAIKVCGITQVEDARWLAGWPIQAIGLNFHPLSPRYVDLETARTIAGFFPSTVEIVGVFVDRPMDEVSSIAEQVGLTTVQLHGGESTAVALRLKTRPIIKAFRTQGSEVRASVDAFTTQWSQGGGSALRVLIDSYRPGEAGGTGHAWSWQSLGPWRPSVPWFLAGGLRPENVRSAIESLRPDGIDLASGVESSPGVKDPRRVEDLIREVDRADATRGNSV